MTEWVFPCSMPAGLMYETLWYAKVNWKSSRTENLLVEQGRAKKPQWTKEAEEAADRFGQVIVHFGAKEVGLISNLAIITKETFTSYRFTE